MSFSSRASKVLQETRQVPEIGKLVDASVVPTKARSTNWGDLCSKIPPGMALEITEEDCVKLGYKMENVPSALSYGKKLGKIPKWFAFQSVKNLDGTKKGYIINSEKPESRIRQ